MDFELSEEHRMLKDLVTRFVKDELLPLEAGVLEREASGLGLGIGTAEHKRLDDISRELGLWGLDAPEDVGGSGDPDLAAIDYPVVAVALGPRRHAGRIAAGAGLGDADGRDRLAAHVGLEIGDPLALVHGGAQHPQVRAVGRQGVGGDGPPQLLLDADHGQRRQVGPADVLGRVQAPEAEAARHLVEALVLVRAEPQAVAGSFAFQHLALEWQELVADEPRHEILEHPMFLGELEIHAASFPAPTSITARRPSHPRRGPGAHVAWQ